MKRSEFFLATLIAPVLAVFKPLPEKFKIKMAYGVGLNQVGSSHKPLHFRIVGRNQFGESIEEWIEIPNDWTTVTTQSKFKEILPIFN